MSARPKTGVTAPARGAPSCTEPRIGRVVSFVAGVVRVEVPGGPPAGLPARVSAAFGEETLAAAARDRQEALLLFDRGDPTCPVLVTLLRSASPLVDALLSAPAGERPVARVDGKRVVIEGREEVVLRCGKASMTLRKDGMVVVKGVNLVSQAERVQKLRGGKVQIN